ncbi:hypothetical protein CERSUDRAFT_124283 [Gelatoporia subvermispora B]|uniref:Uncharacterized protein n=1 Tax=Ceriporiopsis subvermispora (strain B) TaxID=914234 RepID=M2RCE2_CERS8|nr:hypothetical protein CERSUDRAFT_124283 [Gelatoporia subvermispora B]
MFGEELAYHIGKDGVKFALAHRPEAIIKHSYAMLSKSSFLIVYSYDHIPVDERAKFAEDATKVFSELRQLEKRIKEAKPWHSKMRFYIPAIQKAYGLSRQVKDIADEARASSQYAQLQNMTKKNIDTSGKTGDTAVTPSSIEVPGTITQNEPVHLSPSFQNNGTGAVVLTPDGDYHLEIPPGKEAQITCVLRNQPKSPSEKIVALLEPTSVTPTVSDATVQPSNANNARIIVLSPYGQYILYIPPGKVVEVSCAMCNCSEASGLSPALTATRQGKSETHDEVTVVVVPAFTGSNTSLSTSRAQAFTIDASVPSAADTVFASPISPEQPMRLPGNHMDDLVAAAVVAECLHIV